MPQSEPVVSLRTATLRVPPDGAGGPERNVLPGFGLPVRFLPEWTRPSESKKPAVRFPHAISDVVASSGVTIRERRMLQFIDSISDKPEWDRKVFEDEFVEKWKAEACRHVEDLDDDYLSEKMFEFCIAELRDKASRFQETRMIAILDAELTIVKADGIVPSELKQALSDGVKPLEDVPDWANDWHPWSDDKVLDLVHPSLYPVIYGVTRVLERGTVPLLRCSAYSGKGERLERRDEDFEPFNKLYLTKNYDSQSGIELEAWGSYQWLPSEIDISSPDRTSITSYINNLQPTQNLPLYHTLEQIVHLAIPVWNECLSWFHDRMRIVVDNPGADDWYIPEESEGESQSRDGDNDEGDDDDSDGSSLTYSQRMERGVLIQPEPRKFIPFEKSIKHNPVGARPIDLRKDFGSLQIIFKLVNIHLTPEDPEYDSSDWQVEGQLNEHICATALYYYDSHNVTEGRLEFRQGIDPMAMELKPEQGEWHSTLEYYNVRDQEEGYGAQEIGSVCTREDRMIVFPNVLQHRISSFKLADPSQPGHRKLLAMYLVDPHVRILSTAHVPPQQKDWWAEEVRKLDWFERWPLELFDRMIEYVNGFPLSWPEADDIRIELMQERSSMNEAIGEQMENETFDFSAR